MTRAKRTSIIYGPSGNGKTTQLYFIAKWLWETKKLKSRIISAGGGDVAPFVDSGMVDEEIVDIYDLDSSKRPLADIHRLSEGYWPVGKAQILKDDERCKTKPETWEEIGMVAIDHITGVGSMFLSHLSKLEDNAGFKHSIEIREDGEFIGGLQEGHYGIVQNVLHATITKGFRLLPVPYFVVTSLEGIGRIKKTSETIYGPNTCGSAQVENVPSWFGDCIHLDQVETTETFNDEERVKREFSAWFMQHTDPKTDIMYLAKPRVLPEFIPSLVKWANGEGRITLTHEKGLEQYYKAIEVLREKKRKKSD